MPTHQQNKFAVLMLQLIGKYIEMFCSEPTGMASTYAADVAYNATALAVYMHDGDVNALHTAILNQDNVVREFFNEAIAELNKIKEARLL